MDTAIVEEIIIYQNRQGGFESFLDKLIKYLSYGEDEDTFKVGRKIWIGTGGTIFIIWNNIIITKEREVLLLALKSNLSANRIVEKYLQN